MSSKNPITNAMIHRHRTLNSEWGNVEIPSNCACIHQNLTWLDRAHAFMVWDGFKAQGCLTCPHNIWDCPSLHQSSSCSLIVIIRHPIKGIFVETLLKCHETSSNYKPITNVIIHRRRTLSSERGQRWNSFNLCLYASKFGLTLYLLNHREWCNMFFFEELFQESLPPL